MICILEYFPKVIHEAHTHSNESHQSARVPKSRSRNGGKHTLRNMRAANCCAASWDGSKKGRRNCGIETKQLICDCGLAYTVNWLGGSFKSLLLGKVTLSKTSSFGGLLRPGHYFSAPLLVGPPLHEIQVGGKLPASKCYWLYNRHQRPMPEPIHTNCQGKELGHPYSP